MDAVPKSGPRVSSGVSRFLSLTFAGTWLSSLPALAAQRGMLPGAPETYLPLALLGVFAPLGAATWLTAQTSGRTGLRELYGGFRSARFHWLWYPVALLLPGALLALGLALLGLAGYDGPILLNRGLATLPIGILLAVGEEVGWRGYLLPRLQARLDPLAAGGVLGVIWTAWHIPLFLGMGIPLSLLLVMLLYFLGGSLTFSWLYNRSGGSLLLVTLAHLGAHIQNSHVTLPQNVLPLVVHAIVFGSIGLAAVTFDRVAFPRRRSAAVH